MTHRTFACGLLLCLSAVAAPRAVTAGGGAQVAPPLAQANANGVNQDAVDVIFFSGQRPLKLRLRVDINGKSARAYRDAYVKQWFDFLDRDGDGVLSAEEAKLVPTVQSLQQMAQQGFFFNGGRPDQAMTMAQLDANKDGKVSLAELIDHFERSGFAVLQLSDVRAQQTTSARVSQALFEQMKLTKEALGTKEKSFAAADAMMKRFDVDDDETVSMAELLGQPNQPGIPGGVGQPKQPKKAFGNQQVPFHLITPRDNADTVALLLLRNYRKAGADHLTAQDVDLGPGGFAKLDANGDGMLDLAELGAWVKRTPDLEFVMRLGKTDKGELAAELLQPRGKQPPLATAVTKQANGVLSLTVADAQLSLGRNEGPLLERTTLVQRSQVQQLFQFLRNPDKGYIELKDLDGPRGQFLKQMFPLLDQDGDGKLTQKEVDAFALLEAGAMDSCATLTVEDHGRALFQLLDANRDGRLSLRELRMAWERLAPLDRNGDGVISPDEITRQFQLTVVLGSPNSRFNRVAVPRTGTVAGPPTRTVRGPVWFQKMDRNGTGDVSFRNFLGTREQFDRIDVDGDGLISVEEAERYDAQLRKKK